MRRLDATGGATFYLDETSEGAFLVKVLDTSGLDAPDRDALVELENEHRITRELAIPGVRRALRRGEVDGKPALWSTFFAGDTLERAFAGARQPLERVLEVGARLADVLGALHGARIVHGHLSPRAVRVDTAFREVELTRLGLARRIDIAAEPDGISIARSDRAAYAAPEQTGRMNRPVDWRADLYSLGAILYEMLTGAPPIEAESPLELVHELIAVEPAPAHERAPEVPPQLSAIVAKLLAKNAEDRYQSAQGAAADLARCLEHVRRGEPIPAFPLAERDASSRFRLPRRLYGRDAELAALREAVERITAAEPEEHGVELVLLAGRAGTGKSMLVREIERPLTARRGRFIEGKFDQYQREVPFSALSRAFEQWVHLVLAESDDELARQRARVLEAATDLGGLLTQLVPDLELVLGPQPPVPEVGPSEALHRFQYVLRRFVASLADETRPLVLFVDDLQWADPASLELLGTIATSGDAKHLLIVGAYRDDEVPPGHPLALLLDSLARSSAPVRPLAIGPLSGDAVLQLVADTLGDSTAHVRPLAEHVARETGGNALFVGQLLRAMYDEGALGWSHAAGRWEWRLDSAEGGAPSGRGRDVLDLIVAKVRRLPQTTRELLITSACLGSRVDAGTLARISGLGTVDTAAHLEPALREGVLLATGSGHRFLEAGLAIEGGLEAAYVFPHDRVQQAVYSLVPEDERAALHHRLGTALRGLPGERIFDVVHQLNRGRAQLRDTAARRDLARLDLEAGLAAKRAGAYAAALEYLATGLELLGGELAWSTDRALALSLHTEAAECAYLSSAVDRMEAHTDAVLAQAQGILESIRVYNLRVDAYTSQNRLHDAMKVGREALEQLGVRFPRDPKTHHILLGLARTKLALAGKDVPSLGAQRRMTDPKKLEAMLLLERMVPPAYMSGSPLFPLLVFAMVDLSVKYGNSPLSPFGYGSFAITLSGVLGDVRSGEVFGKTALETMEILGADTFRAKVYFVLYVFITHWTQHLADCIDPLLDAYHSGMKAGNLVGATWSGYYRLLWLCFTGAPLPELEREAATYSAIFSQLQQNAAHRRTDMLRQAMLNLMGRSGHPVDFTGETYHDSEIETLSAKGDDATSRFFFHQMKCMLDYLFDRPEEAVRHGDAAREFLEAATGLPELTHWTYWDALARIRASESARGRASTALVRGARAKLAKLAKWGEFAPMNYGHKHDLVAAELARLEGDDARARELYDRAIAGATEHRYVQDAALACELAARFHRMHCRRELAAFYLSRAHEGYLRWGAIAKADALESAHPELGLRARRASMESERPLASAPDIDLASVVKATTAISGEIRLDRLGATLLAIAAENAGAQRGALVLWDDGDGRIVARKEPKGEVATGLDLPLSSGAVAETAVAYVARSKRPLVVGDAQSEPRFARDPRVLAKRVRSMLVMPIVHHGALLALVYLENNLVPDAFTPERLTLLGVLGGQIAISLENAKLYRNLEISLDRQKQLTQAYSRFTPKAFLDFLGAESILDVRLGDQRHGDMTVLFADIRSYTSLSESMSPDDNFGFINGFLSRMNPVITEHGGVVSDFLGDGVMAFFPRDPEDALRAAIGMQRAVRAYNGERRAKGRAPITMGVGMHTGPLMIGVIGDQDRMDAALVSDTVNTAARMEGITKELRVSIAVSESTVSRIEGAFDRFGLRRVGDVRLKGKSQVVRVYECFDADGDSPSKRAAIAEFEEALAAFQRADFADASEAFARLLEAHEGDRTAARYLERAREYGARGVPEGWKGVEAMERK